MSSLTFVSLLTRSGGALDGWSSRHCPTIAKSRQSVQAIMFPH
jgi:hypothetical protein